MIDLRALKEEDCDRLFRWRRETEVDRWMSDLPAQSAAEHEQWFAAMMCDEDQRGWIITYNGDPAGYLALTGLAGRHKRAAWGWYIGEAWARGRGVGRAAQALGLDQAFFTLGLQKVWAEVLADNDTALKAQAAAGFRREGYLRRHVLKDGIYRDVVTLAILADEWSERRDKVRQGLAISNLIVA